MPPDDESPGGAGQDGGGLGSVPEFPEVPALLNAEEDTQRQRAQDAARDYAAQGFYVIPVRWIGPDGFCSCSHHEDCANPAKHPVHDAWPSVASRDPDVVASWWRPEPEIPATEWFPYSNVGIVTGQKFGIFVLDVDSYAGGAQTLERYERRNGSLPETRVHSSARGGTHYFFRHPGFDVRNSARRVLGTGLDVRGENGFVVAPPSVGKDGGRYELNPAHDLPPVDAPDWLLDLLRTHDRQQTGAVGAGDFITAPNGQVRKYVEAALRAETEKMRAAGEGMRNETLNQCAFSLGTLGSLGLITEETAFAALSDAARTAGLGEAEIKTTFGSGWRAGLKNPREIHWQAMGSDWPPYARTDFGNADRMAYHFADTFRWCDERDSWVEYQGGVWRTVGRNAGEWKAQLMIRRLPYTEALSYDADKTPGEDGTMLDSPREDFIKWAEKQQTRAAVSAAARLAMGVPLMQISESTFDPDPLKLNAQNGVVDLTTGELLPHSPDYRMTLQAAAAFHGLDTPAPQWGAFLRRVQPDPEMRRYLQKVAGYCATGLTIEQVFFLWHGQGANGKSVAQSVLAHVLGSYAQTMPTDTLMASSVDGRISNDVARMKGRRFLVASETKSGKGLDEQKLKQLTGGDTVAARYMRAEYFEFVPVGKIQLTTNHLPRVSDDAAMWRRIHLITWPVIIPESERDGGLQQRLIEEEAAGILAWIARGALMWLEEGLAPPAAVHEAKESYQKEEDVVGQFAEVWLEVVPPRRRAVGRSVAEIYGAYAMWCEQQRISAMSQKSLTARLGKRSEHYRGGGWSGFPGLQVRQVPFYGPDDEEAPPAAD